ncbi:2-hydroxyacid dehydrogenase [Anaeramoeba flamelloides]|uniref:2-hydroxyacid dehydrogenase n=1 Tax=Anaeramoeba flamelloides TaxID=1746091 RepID=A0AAV8AGW9_9EUKA|nr:2-hydroxyacid dehydrogenase [Anaeramoeba flamelloides]KAJ6252682.1 2-hydroxyacid dehydrogenase [Anaeramoeba flamelloides]
MLNFYSVKQPTSSQYVKRMFLTIKPKIYVTRVLPDKAMKLLDQYFDYDVFQGHSAVPQETLIKNVKDCVGLLCLLTDRINENVIHHPNFSKIQMVANYAVGYENVNVAELSKLKIPVTNTPGCLTEATADIAMSLILTTHQRFLQRDQALRSNQQDTILNFQKDTQDLNLDPLCNKTLGIIGLGRIGQALAMRARGFGMKILAYNRTPKPEVCQRIGVEELGKMDELLQYSDFVSLNCPCTEETKHLIAMEQLKMMKESAILINTARGKVVLEDDLISALKNGIIKAAGLDVLYNEPQVNPELSKLHNTVLLPHIGSATTRARTGMGMLAAQSLVDYLVHKKWPKNFVNKSVFI